MNTFLMTIVASLLLTMSLAQTHGKIIMGCGEKKVNGKYIDPCQSEFVAKYRNVKTENSIHIDIDDENLLKMIMEVEEAREKLIGTYYDKEIDQLTKNKLTTDYFERLARLEQLKKMSAIQKQRDAIKKQMEGVKNDYPNDEPFYSLSKKLQDLDDLYKKEEENYLKLVAKLQVTVDKEVEEARKAVDAGGINDDWQLFQLATKGFSERAFEITKGRSYDKLSTTEKQAIDSIEASIVDLEVMAISVAAVKHLRCEPVSNIAGDNPTRPESYDLFRSGASMYIASQINQTTDQNVSIKLITQEGITTEEDLKDPEKNITDTLELNQQLVNMKVSTMLMQQQVSAIQLRHANKADALGLFKSAYDAALLEYDTKQRKLDEINKKIEGAKGRENYNQGEEEKFDMLSIIAFGIAAYCTAQENYGCAAAFGALGVYREMMRDDHKDKKDLAKKKLAEYEKEKKEYELHAHLKCKAIGDIDAPKELIGQTYLKKTEFGIQQIENNKLLSQSIKKRMLFSWLKMRGFISFNQNFNTALVSKTLNMIGNALIGKAQAETQTQEQGLALKAESENFRYFVETKNIELYNPAAKSDAGSCPGVETQPRGQIQAFPYPCHRMEYLGKVVNLTGVNVNNLAKNEFATAIDRRNTFAAFTHTNRVRMAERGQQGTGLVAELDVPQMNKATEQAPIKFKAPQNLIALNSGLNKINPLNKILNDSIKEKEDSINGRLDKSGKIDFKKRTTQLRINTRKIVVSNFSKKNKSPFFNDLLANGGSFNSEDVKIAEALNHKSSGGVGALNQLAKKEDDKKIERKKFNFDFSRKNFQAGLKKGIKAKKFNNKYTFGSFDSFKVKNSDDETSTDDVNEEIQTARRPSGMKLSRSMIEDISDKNKYRNQSSDTLFTRISNTYIKKGYPRLLDLE